MKPFEIQIPVDMKCPNCGKPPLNETEGKQQFPMYLCENLDDRIHFDCQKCGKGLSIRFRPEETHQEIFKMVKKYSVKLN